MALLALSGPQGSYLVNILGPSVVIGVGMALIFLPLSLAAGTGVPADCQGIASGSINGPPWPAGRQATSGPAGPR